jgi:hypothetical protein
MMVFGSVGQSLGLDLAGKGLEKTENVNLDCGGLW